MKVTRIAYSNNLNTAKYGQLVEQAHRLGVVRALVWRRFGSINGVGISDRQIRDQWLADGTAAAFGVLANAWKETLRDAMADIKASREAAKVLVRKAIHRRYHTERERRDAYAALKRDTWTSDAFLCRLMRKHWRPLPGEGNVWLAVPSLARRKMISIPLNTTVAPTGTLRLIVRDRRVEVHYAIDAADLRELRPCGTAKIAVDQAKVAPCCQILGKHLGDRLHCTPCGDVWQADHAGAINILERDGDPDISLHTPHMRVRQILQERADRHRTRLPVQDSSPPGRRANHPMRAHLPSEQEAVCSKTNVSCPKHYRILHPS